MEAANKVDKFLRAEYPDVTWMSGNSVESGGVQYLPSTRVKRN